MTAATPIAFQARRLSFTYEHAPACAVCDVDIDVAHGSFCAIIGPNGSGKSTLLRLLLGAETPTSGDASFNGQAATAWDRAALAREVGVVTQSEEIVFPLTVRELVAMGRYPHLGPYRREGEADRRAVEDALSACDVLDLSARPMGTLSGGERQRVRIARALAQQPGTLVLDEPTAALDIAHEMSIFELLFRLAGTSGVTVLLVTHNINLAARYATHLVLLERGHVAAQGAPADVLTRARVQDTYQWPVSVQPHPGPGPDQNAPQIIPLRKEEL